MNVGPLTSTQLELYFRRIGYAGKAAADLDTLQQVHALHPLRIPFENLNSWLGAPVSLQPAAVFDKLVLQQRGGYCFEQNQLLLRVLQTLGFEVLCLSARVLWMLPADVQLPRTHMALLVKVAGRDYLADVGFGGLTMTAALELHNSAAQSTPHEHFRLMHADGIHTLQASLAGHYWQPLYSFSLDPCLPVDYETANWYVSTHPESRFVNQLIAGRADKSGRHALLDRRYSRYLPEQSALVIEVQSPAELRSILQEQFLLDLSALPRLEDKLANLFRITA